MTAETLISFLVPTYNGGGYLVTAIESIAGQLVDGDEVLVHDGASEDGSIEQLQDRFPDAPWLKIVSEPDRGQSDALGKGLERAANPYIMWLNADDIVYPGALAAVRAALCLDPDIVAGRSTIFTNEGRIVRTYSPGAITRRAMLGHSSDLFSGSLVMRTALVRKAGGFNPKYQYCMDLDLFSRIAELGPAVQRLPDVVAGLRWHAESKGGTTVWPIVTEATEVKLAHAQTPYERVLAIGTSTAYLVAALAQPIRHSPAYSALRRRLTHRTAGHHAPVP